MYSRPLLGRPGGLLRMDGTPGMPTSPPPCVPETRMEYRESADRSSRCGRRFGGRGGGESAGCPRCRALQGRERAGAGEGIRIPYRGSGRGRRGGGPGGGSLASRTLQAFSKDPWRGRNGHPGGHGAGRGACQAWKAMAGRIGRRGEESVHSKQSFRFLKYPTQYILPNAFPPVPTN